MRPSLEPGDIVFAYKTNPIHIEVDDIVLFKHPIRQLIAVKRVHSISDDGRFDLRGDNALESTDSRSFGSISAQEILGVIK